MSDVSSSRNNMSAGIIKHYDLLKQTGVLDQMLILTNENKLLDELLNEALVFFNKHTVFELINYVTQKMLDKFVPLFLAFIIQEEFTPDKAKIICFKNLQPVDNIITLKSLDPYRHYFTLMPAPITFEAFKYIFDNTELTDVFLPLLPELMVPMMGLDGMYGFIIFGQKVVGSKYTHDEIVFIDKIMKFASASLQNNIHYTRSIIESKTRLYNHGYFIRRLDEEISKVKRYNSFFALLLIDIDHFKNLNDKYGHIAGDHILSEIADIFEENIRKGDIAARFGGEEFIILLYQADIANAYKIAERIRSNIQNSEYTYSEISIFLTVSTGITFVSKENYHDSDELIRQADKALYHAKKSGRNQTVVYSQEIEDKPK